MIRPWFWLLTCDCVGSRMFAEKRLPRPSILLLVRPVLATLTGPHAHTPLTHSECVAGPGRTPQGRAVGCGRVPSPGRPPARQEPPPPPGALVPPPQRAKAARKSARCGVGDRCPSPHPPHRQLAGSRPRPHGPRPGGRAWESAQPRTPHIQTRVAPPRAPSCRPHSAQSQLTRARAVGLVTGPYTHTPRTDRQWVAGPGRTPQGRAVGLGRAPNPRRPTPMQEAPPLAASCRPHSAQRQLARARVVELVTGAHAHTLRTHNQRVAGPGRTARGRAVGRGRAPSPGPPTSRQEGHPPGALMPPSKRSKPAHKSARSGVGDGSLRPHTPHRQPVGSGPRPHAPRTAGRAWESAQP